MIVARPVDWAIRMIQFGFGLSLIIGFTLLALPRVRAFLGDSTLEASWVGGLVVAGGLAIVMVLLLNFVPQLQRVVRRFPSQLKRQIFLLCAGVGVARDRSSNLCRAVASEFRRHLLPYSRQGSVVSKIYANILNSTEGTCFDVIVGPSGTGKTRAAVLLLESLVRDRLLCRLADRSFYYDFSVEDRIQDDFLHQLGGSAHADGLVILDNFHLARPDTLEAVTIWLIDALRKPSERHFLLLAQPGPAWRLNPGMAVKILQVASQLGALHCLENGLDAEALDSLGLDETARQRLSTLRRYSSDKLASIAEVQSISPTVQTSSIGGIATSEVLAYLFDDKVGTQGDDRVPELSKVIGITAALAYNRGTFSPHEFRICFLAISNETGIAKLRALIRARRILKGLARQGIMPRTSLPKQPYVFHEKLVEQFRDRLGAIDKGFEAAFRAALLWRLDVSQADLRPQFRWLSAVELRDTNAMRDQFDAAVADGGLSVMERRLKAHLDCATSLEAKFQYGFILDKMGRFAKAREALRYVSEASRGSDLAVKCQLALIEAEHGPDAFESTAEIQSNEDPKLALSGSYWSLHIAAHAGRFDAQGLFDLADQFVTAFQPSDVLGDYALSTLASRLLFDGCRHLYLQRPQSMAEGLKRWSDHKITSIVRATDPCFQANSTLYFRAHWRSHVQLSSQAVMGRYVAHPREASTPLTERDVSRLRVLAEAEYREAAEQFSTFGNREALYLKGDLVNCRIQDDACDPKAVQPQLAEYESFIQQTGFEDLASYPEVLKLRLNIRSWLLALSASTSNDLWIGTADDRLAAAKANLKQIKAYDEKCANQYGLWRADLYAVLINLLGDSVAHEHRRQSCAELQALAERAEAAGYFGDARFAAHLGAINDLTIGVVIRALLFHPFVHQ